MVNAKIITRTKDWTLIPYFMPNKPTSYLIGLRKKGPRSLRFEYWRSIPDGQWYWHLKSGNGEIIAQGEGYRRESSCLRIYALLVTVSLQGPKKLPIAPPVAPC